MGKKYRRVPRRRFHALRLELLMVLVIAAVLAYCFREAFRPPRNPRHASPLRCALTPLKCSSQEYQITNPAMFAFGSDSAPWVVSSYSKALDAPAHSAMGTSPAVPSLINVALSVPPAPSVPFPETVARSASLKPAPGLFDSPRPFPSVSEIDDAERTPPSVSVFNIGILPLPVAVVDAPGATCERVEKIELSVYNDFATTKEENE